MVYDEFIALDRGLLRHPARALPRRHLKAAPGVDASAIHGRLGAQAALLQSPILPAARSRYTSNKTFQNVPVDKPHTRVWRALFLPYSRYACCFRYSPSLRSAASAISFSPAARARSRAFSAVLIA